jgi:hypothetical protein
MYCVDMYCRIEQNNYNWIRNNQATIRAELYQGLTDAISGNNRET